MKHKNKIVTHMLTLTLNLILALKLGGGGKGKGRGGPNFDQNYPIFFKFSQFDPILAHIVNVRILKNQPIHTPNFTLNKGSLIYQLIYQEADFTTHVCGTSP